MSVNLAEIGQLVGVARAVVDLIDATTITIGDLTGQGPKFTRNSLATLVNRAQKELGLPNVTDLSES